MMLQDFCKFDKYILVVSGVNYMSISNGTGKVVKCHESIFNSVCIDYIVLQPCNPKGMYTKCYSIVVNGMYYGIRTYKEFIYELVMLKEANFLGFLIHHLIYTEFENISDILRVFPNAPIVFYLHDFYSYCVNPKMLKNDEVFCAYQDVDCDGCKYRIDKMKHLVRMKTFLNNFDNQLIFVSPSEFTKNIWLKLYPQYKDKLKVIPHLVPFGAYYGNGCSSSCEEKLKIGYVGSQSHTKGWGIFKRCMNTAQTKGCKYEYFSFGKKVEEIKHLENINVQIHLQGKNAMIDALRDNKIDVVFLCSIWPETYSYTLYESMAANCFIVTTELSGNIAYVIKTENYGYVFKSDSELEECFSNEIDFRKMIDDWRERNLKGALYYKDNTEILNCFDKKNVYVINENIKGEVFFRKFLRKILTLAYMLKNKLFLK